MKILIGNINVNNEELLSDLIADCGYSGCLQHGSLISSTLDLGSDNHRLECGIEQHEVNKLIYELLNNGFVVTKI